MKIHYYTLLFILIFYACACVCAQTPKYQVSKLDLNKTNLELNIKEYFSDEYLFRDGTIAVSEEELFDDSTSTRIPYVQFSTQIWSSDKPILVNFRNIAFKKIGIITNDDEDKIWVIAAETDNTKSEDIIGVIDYLLDEKNERPQLNDNWTGTNIIFKTPEKTYIVHLNFSLDYGSMVTKKKILTDELYNQIKTKLNKKQTNNFQLLISDPAFDSMFSRSKNHGTRGFMTSYKIEGDYFK